MPISLSVFLVHPIFGPFLTELAGAVFFPVPYCLPPQSIPSGSHVGISYKPDQFIHGLVGVKVKRCLDGCGTGFGGVKTVGRETEASEQDVLYRLRGSVGFAAIAVRIIDKVETMQESLEVAMSYPYLDDRRCHDPVTWQEYSIRLLSPGPPA